ncbi:hypothetical protein C162_03147 [Paenibacillus sp. FSL R7-269]|nr:hypothetical protein C162_03147 [Paenibacillus sp. FSL R7-269]
MLDDTPRKLLRIIVQFKYHFKRIPTIRELGRLSGRRPAEHYIEWEAGMVVMWITGCTIKGIYYEQARWQ